MVKISSAKSVSEIRNISAHKDIIVNIQFYRVYNALSFNWRVKVISQFTHDPFQLLLIFLVNIALSPLITDHIER